MDEQGIAPPATPPESGAPTQLPGAPRDQPAIDVQALADRVYALLISELSAELMRNGLTYAGGPERAGRDR